MRKDGANGGPVRSALAMRTLRILSPFSLGIVLIMMGTISAAAASLEIVGVSAPDGTVWTLGSRGVGRPFSVRIVLGNRSKGALRIWRPESADGAHLAWVTLRDQAGRETKLEWPAKPRFGLPSSMVLESNGTAVYTLELLRAQDITNLTPGTYQLVAHYANRTGGDGQSQGVWTGELASEPLTIRIVSP